jgi:hypothetical protein
MPALAKFECEGNACAPGKKSALGEREREGRGGGGSGHRIGLARLTTARWGARWRPRGGCSPASAVLGGDLTHERTRLGGE